MNAERVDAYKCDICGTTYITKLMAEKCCEKKYCKYCGKELPHKYYFLACPDCREKHKYDNYRRMTYEEYIKEFPGYPVGYEDGDYVEFEMEDLLEYIRDSLSDEEWGKLQYVIGYDMYYAEIDAESVLENIEEDQYEDFEFDETGRKEFIDFVSRWNEKYRKPVYTEAKILVEIPKELKEALN